MNREGVLEWRQPPLEAATFGVHICREGSVGVTFHAQDSNPFAHARLTPQAARLLIQQLMDAVTSAEGGPKQ